MYEWVVTNGVVREFGLSSSLEDAEREAAACRWRHSENEPGFDYEVHEVTRRRVAGSQLFGD